MDGHFVMFTMNTHVEECHVAVPLAIPFVSGLLFPESHFIDKPQLESRISRIEIFPVGRVIEIVEVLFCLGNGLFSVSGLLEDVAKRTKTPPSKGLPSSR